MITNLNSKSSTDSLLFGAKAANLARAMRSGLPVPQGIVISHEMKEPLSTILQKEMANASLSPPYAIRSSSQTEDGSNRAFPGVFETVLGSSSLDEVVTAITRVRASADSPSVRDYAGDLTAPVKMGVILQELVTAVAAGVAFSRDPITGEQLIIIESSYGLGKAVVDGEVTPDSYEFSPNGKLINRKLGTKRVRFDFSGIGLSKNPVGASEAALYAITDGEAGEVCQLALRAESLIGSPVDIEWAFDSNRKLWLLQARPITTLAEADDREAVAK